MKIINAQIESTMLGYEDHGILTISLTLDFGEGSVQGFGGYSLGSRNNSDGKALHRHLTEILKVVGVDTWEELQGQYIRVKKEGIDSRITAIGNLLEDKWFDPKK